MRHKDNDFRGQVTGKGPAVSESGVSPNFHFRLFPILELTFPRLTPAFLLLSQLLEQAVLAPSLEEFESQLPPQ